MNGETQMVPVELLVFSVTQFKIDQNKKFKPFKPSKYWPLSTSCKTERGPITNRHGPDKRHRYV